MNPPKSILNPAFRYTPAAKTDLRKTFAKIRKERERNEQEAARVVKPMVRPGNG